MADTVAAAVKAACVATGAVGGRVWADEAPAGVTWPYVTFDVADASTLLAGDARSMVARQVVTVHLWERQAAESEGVVATLASGLDGTKVALSGGNYSRLRVAGTARLVEPENDVVHHAVTVTLSRSLTVA